MPDDYIRFHAGISPNAPAVVLRGEGITFARFNSTIDTAAHFLHEAGFLGRSGVSVSIRSPYLHWVMVLALFRLGRCVFPAGDGAVERLVLEGEDEDGELALSRSEARRLLNGDASPFPRLPRGPAAAAYMLESSGSTGDPKRVVLSYGLLDARVRSAFIAYGAPPGIWRATTGIATALGLVVSLACWAAGNALLIPHRLGLEARALARWRPSLIACIPGQLRVLVEELPDGFPRWPLRVVTGGGPVPPALVGLVRDRLTGDVRSVYGASETGAVAVATCDLLERRRGAAGFVLPDMQVEIVDDDGNPQPPETVGEIRVRGERVVDGYADDPELGGPAFRDGGFYTRDLAMMSAGGELVVVGRKDDLMNLGGRKLLPEPIEAAASGCEGVSDAAACSVVDAAGFESCWLAVATNGEVDEARLLGEVAKAIGWAPRLQVAALPTIPRNAMGKIDRPRLRRIIAERGRAEKSC
jgi:acyl-CoA synthetase (AMP-forming)/AMP-acid ligase II